jgi:hypothetical protein
LPSVLGGGARHSVTFRMADPGARGAGPVSRGDRPYRQRSPWLAHTHHVQPRRALTLRVPGSPIPAEKPGSCACCPWNYAAERVKGIWAKSGGNGADGAKPY